MNKKTIASLAILASTTSAFALIGPGGQRLPRPKTVCLSVHEGETGELYVGDCDLSEQNRRTRVRLQANGCARNQAALQSYSVTIKACPGFAQL